MKSLLVLAVTFTFPVLAFAHAHLTSSTPAKDSVLSVVPNEVVLHFNEDLEAAMCKITVKNLKSGAVISQVPVQQATDKRSLKVALKPEKDAAAEYEVSWRAVAEDAHSMPGTFKFKIGKAKTK